MKQRNVLVMLVVVVIGFAAMVIWSRRHAGGREPFDREQTLTFSEQARCMMSCEQITETEIREVVRSGIINLNRSDRRAKPCPIFALQGTTARGRSLRVELSQCAAATTVLASYYLHRDTLCPCLQGKRQN